MEQITLQLPVGKISPQRVLGLKIRMYRLYRGFSKKQLEEQASLPVTCLNRIETGKQAVDVLDLNKISVVLNIPITDFLPNR